MSQEDPIKITGSKWETQEQNYHTSTWQLIYAQHNPYSSEKEVKIQCLCGSSCAQHNEFTYLSYVDFVCYFEPITEN